MTPDTDYRALAEELRNVSIRKDLTYGIAAEATMEGRAAAAIEALLAERDELQGYLDRANTDFHELDSKRTLECLRANHRAQAAEARCSVLEEALREIAEGRAVGVLDPAGDGGTRILTGHEFRDLQAIAQNALAKTVSSEGGR